MSFQEYTLYYQYLKPIDLTVDGAVKINHEYFYNNDTLGKSIGKVTVLSNNINDGIKVKGLYINTDIKKSELDKKKLYKIISDVDKANLDKITKHLLKDSELSKLIKESELLLDQQALCKLLFKIEGGNNRNKSRKNRRKSNKTRISRKNRRKSKRRKSKCRSRR